MPRSCGRELEEQKTAMVAEVQSKKKHELKEGSMLSFDLHTNKSKLLKSWQCFNHGRCGEE